MIVKLQVSWCAPPADSTTVTSRNSQFTQYTAAFQHSAGLVKNLTQYDSKNNAQLHFIIFSTNTAAIFVTAILQSSERDGHVEITVARLNCLLKPLKLENLPSYLQTISN